MGLLAFRCRHPAWACLWGQYSLWGKGRGLRRGW